MHVRLLRVCDVAIKAARSSHHVTREVVQVVERALQGVCVHVQDDHVLQRSTAHSLREEKGAVSAAADQRRYSHHYYFTSFNIIEYKRVHFSIHTHSKQSFIFLVFLNDGCAGDFLCI